MSKNKEAVKPQTCIPFYLATDEGEVHSEHVALILGEVTAGDASKYHGKRVTELRLNTPRFGDKDNKYRPYVLASKETLKAVFEAHGYTFVTESALEKFEGKGREQIAEALGLRQS